MTISNVRQLKTGDVVAWTDPDRELCSRDYTVQSVAVVRDFVVITEPNGDELECLARELTQKRPFAKPCTCREDDLNAYGLSALCESCAAEYAAWSRSLCSECGDQPGTCARCADDAALELREAA